MLEFNFNPFPVIHTERLTLRSMNMDDAADWFELRRNINMMRYIDRPPYKSIDEAKEVLGKILDGLKNNETIAWNITLKGNPKMIGNISFHRTEKENHRAEIGYMLHPDQWRKGIVSEAMAPVLHYGFNNMKLHSIEANVNPENLASINLLKKYGFVKEAYFKENYFFDGKFIDSEIYSLLGRNFHPH